MKADSKQVAALHELRGGGTLLALAASAGERPAILYCGPDIPGASAGELALLATRQHAHGSSTLPLDGSLLNEAGTGIGGPSGLIAHRGGRDWVLDLRVNACTRVSDTQLKIECVDDTAALGAIHDLAIDSGSGALRCSTTIGNRGEDDLSIEWCAALCLPLDPRLDRVLSFTGRWAGEFQLEEVEVRRGSFVHENRRGRTSHDAFPGIYAVSRHTSETSGPAAGFHLSWSGNHRLQVDRHNDGRTFVQAGELLLPGEMLLEPGQSYRTPELIACWSEAGTGDVSRRFHRYLEERVLDKRAFAKPRPVHFNTWEAVYFDHDPARLEALAEKAAAVGAERFILDDGWFGARRSDGAGLGDWQVSADIYPDGLTPLVAKVRELGMEFGLWFEPEMVNPDSELYRSHPDWVLGAEGVATIPFRNQLTLDLTREEVVEYLYDAIAGLVAEHGIDYIKWDMNRDTHHPVSDGRAVMHRQTHALYRLMQRLREQFPDLEIESCASGGARADFGVLRQADRIWTSDNNDARDRQAIQRGASYFFPLRVLGNHVGPKRCHITGRRFPMSFRVASAIFGHMGLELDLDKESAADLDLLTRGIALHKRFRNLIHEGAFHRVESDMGTNVVGCVAQDRAEALFSFAQLESQRQTQPQRLRLAGLDPSRSYRVGIVWPVADPSLTRPSIVDAAKLMGEGSVFSGSALMQHGIQAPLTYPDICIIYHVKSEG